MSKKAKSRLALALKKEAKACGTYKYGPVDLSSPRSVACYKASRELGAAIRADRARKGRHSSRR